MGQIKHKMGKVGGGVDISHKSKMSGKAKNLMSFPGGMPGPGDYGKVEQPAKIVGKGMAKYLAGESVGMRKMDPMYNGQPGVQQEDFEQFGAPKSTGPAKKTRSQRQEDRDKAKTERRAKRADKRVKRNKNKVEKLQSKIDLGKENFNVDEAGNKTTGRKANRIEKAKKKITDNEKISAKKPKKEETTSTRSYGMFKYDDGPMKTKMDPKKDAKALKSLREIAAKKKKDKLDEKLKRGPSGRLYAKSVSREKRISEMKSAGMKKTDPVIVKGDKSKVNNKVTKTDAKAKKIALLKEKRAIKSAQAKEKIKEKRNMIQVRRDLEANKRNQKKRKRDGKDYQANTGTDNQKTIRRS